MFNYYITRYVTDLVIYFNSSQNVIISQIFFVIFSYIFKLVTSQGLQQHETSVKVKVLPGSPPSVEIKPPRNSMKPRITVLLKSSQNRSTSFSCEGVVENGE